MKKLVYLFYTFVIFVVSTLLVNAAEVPWSGQRYSHYSDQESISDVLNSLMSAQGVPVVVSGDVTGALSGRFQKMQAQDVFEQIISTYNLVWYYDTHTLYVYNSDEMQTGTIKLQALTVAEFRQSLKDLGIFDVRFSWQASEPDGLIFFSGPQRYVTLVMEMAEVLDSQRNRLTVYRWKDNDGVTNFSTASPGSHQNQVAIINLERTEIEPSKTFIQVSHNHQIEAEKESSLLVPVE